MRDGDENGIVLELLESKDGSDVTRRREDCVNGMAPRGFTDELPLLFDKLVSQEVELIST